MPRSTKLAPNLPRTRQRPTEKYRFVGEFYVVKYDNGLIKVGQSQDARYRIRGLRTETYKPGLLIESWHSIPHVTYLLNELRMLVFCHENFGDPATGNETFWGEYDKTLTYAQSLPRT